MGPLYVNQKEMNPTTMMPPPGNKTQPFTAKAVDFSPMDEHNTLSASYTGPKDRPNPAPKDKYDLVVIGAGVAGLLSVISAKVSPHLASLLICTVRESSRRDACGAVSPALDGPCPPHWLCRLSARRLR